MVVQHNMTAINANRYFGVNNSKLSKSLEKLSSGYAINRAGDNAAGLAVSEKMRSQIAGINQGVKNAQDGISMVQTYEGALTETHSILQRMKTLANQSANGTYDDPVDRNAIQQEFMQLNDELDQIADTDFNGVVVLNGGTMADGTRAVSGKFDYTDTTSKREAVKLGAGDFVVGEAKGSITSDETVTFTYTDNGDGTGAWTQSGGTAGSFSSKNTGGFAYNGYVFTIDSSSLVTGDSVEISFKKDVAAQAQGAANLGYTYDGFSKDPMGAVTLGTAVPASQSECDLINSLQGATISISTDATGKTDALAANSITLADGSKIKIDNTASAATAADPLVAKMTAAGDLEIYAWASADGTAAASSIKLVSIAGITAGVADNKSKNGTLTLSFADAVYEPKKPGGYTFANDTVSVSKSNAYENSEAQMTYTDNITLQVGARTKDAVNFTFEYQSTAMGDLKSDLNCTAEGLGTNKLSLATQDDANAAIDKIDQAINKVSMVRGTFGAIQNRLEHKIDNLNTTSENLTSAESRIRDTNMAEEMMNFTKNQILSQASQSMLAQANQLPQGVLSLLQ